VCGIFGHMAYYCRNRREKGLAQVPSNKFKVLKSRVMQKEERSGKEVEKNRREILKEERAKKKKTKIEKKEKKEKVLGGDDKGKKNLKEEKEKEKKIEEKEKKVEKRRQEAPQQQEKKERSFSGGEILRGRYPLVWQKKQCYKCEDLGHKKRDHREIEKQTKPRG